jgi:quinolinate synthase
MIRYAKHMRKENNVNRLSPPTFIVATEAGIMHELKRMCPDCTFIPVPPEISEGATSCGCNECQYMKLNTLEKLRNCLRDESPVVDVDPAIAKDAVKPINRMLELS